MSSLVNGRANLSVKMALRIEQAFGSEMETLLRMQMSYDIAQVRRREKAIRLRRYRPPRRAA